MIISRSRNVLAGRGARRGGQLGRYVSDERISQTCDTVGDDRLRVEEDRRDDRRELPDGEALREG